MRSQAPRHNTAAVFALGLAVLFGLSACAGMAGPNNVADVATNHISGFWPGLWQGIVIPISFIVSLFNHHVNIYDVHNNGGWYNFGFLVGAGILVGVGRAGRH